MKKVLPPAHLITDAEPHALRVQKLYKEALKVIRSHNLPILNNRYASVCIRKRFDDNRDIKDFAKAKEVLDEGWKEIEYFQHPFPLEYTHCPGGIAYGRDLVCRDYHLDLWPAPEKKQYPDYFAKREQRKAEYIERWNKKYKEIKNN